MSKKFLVYLKQILAPSRSSSRSQLDDAVSISSNVIYNKKTNIIETTNPSIKVHPKGLAYYLHKSMKKHAQNVAQIDALTGEQETYEEFLELAEVIALQMRSRGVVPFDVICFCCANNMRLAVTYIAALLLGARTVSLEPTMSNHDIEDMLKELKPKMIFVEHQTENSISDIVVKWSLNSEIIVFDYSRKNSVLIDFAMGAPDVKFEPYVVKSLDEIALILVSSGSVENYKCICFNHYTILHYAIEICFGTTLEFCPLFQIASLLNMLSCVVYGFSRVVCRKFAPAQMWYFIDQYEVTYIYLTPYQAEIFFDKLIAGSESYLKYMAIGGDTITTERMIQYNHMLPNTAIFLMYVQAEMPVPFLVDYGKNFKVGCVGSPKDGFSYKIVKPGTDETLTVNFVGELRIKSDECMSYYYTSSDRQIWDIDGYLKTGDLAYYDKFFGFYIIGNMYEMIHYMGSVFRPLKVESIILRHPEVEFCSVIGITLDGMSDRIVAFVTPDQNSHLTPVQLEEFYLKEAPPKYQVISHIVFIDYLPLTPSYKVCRRVLRKLYIKNALQRLR